MPVTQAQLLQGANYQFEQYATGDPVDQFSTERPLALWLIKNKVDSVFGNGIFNEKVRITNDSNYQNYTGDDEVTFNRKDTVRKAPFQHYEAHDGFALNETELADNGIIMTDDRTATMTDAESIQIVSKLKEGWTTLKDGFQENWDLEMHLDGQQSTKACPGIDLIVSTTPNVGVIGGIDAATATYWRNNANLNISTVTTGNLIKEFEKSFRACTTHGQMKPDFIPVGSIMYDAFRDDARKSMQLQVSVSSSGGVSLDPSTNELRFKGVLVVWDPTFDALDAKLGVITYPWAKRAYFLNSKALKLRPFKGRWMVQRKPERVYNRYTHFFATTADYGLTTSRRNAMAVLSIA